MMMRGHMVPTPGHVWLWKFSIFPAPLVVGHEPRRPMMMMMMGIGTWAITGLAFFVRPSARVIFRGPRYEAGGPPNQEPPSPPSPTHDHRIGQKVSRLLRSYRQ
uniref:Uncharacterized protein n=1 Tax=Anopheles maculatus TaxID=74869 RepID=A0A182SVQ7_9DIPT